MPTTPLGPPPDPGPATATRLRPDDLYQVGRHFLDAQDSCAKVRDALQQGMVRNARVIGKDTSGVQFGDAYMRLADVALDGFARAHGLLGAIGLGLAVAAENHRQADAASTPPGHPASQPFPPLAPRSLPPKSAVPPIGGATEWWLVAPLDSCWPLSDQQKSVDLSNEFSAAQRDFQDLVDHLHNGLTGLFTNNASDDLHAAESFWGRVTHGSVLDALPLLLGEIDKAISAYDDQVMAWRDRFRQALEDGLAAAGLVAVGSVVVDVLTEVGWGAIGPEASAAAGAAAEAVTPVAIEFAAVAEGAATSGAVAAGGIFTVAMANTPDPKIQTSDATRFGDQVEGPRYEPSPKHGATQRGDIAPAPKDGQAALDRSVQIKETSTRRVGVDAPNNELVVFDETYPGKDVFHGHVRSWAELRPEMQNALRRAGLTDSKGRIIP